MIIAVICPYILTPQIQEKLGIRVEDYTRATGTINLSLGLSKIPGVDVHQISMTRHIRGTKLVRDGNINIHFVGIPPKLTSFTFLQYPKLLVHRELKKIKPDIVHGHHAETGDPYYAITSNYRSIAGIHNYLPMLMKITGQPSLSTMAIFRHFEKYTIKNASHITVDSRYIGEIISPLTTAKIHRIPNCVHSDFFNHSKVDYDSKTDGRLTIAFFGQLRREKGLEILMDALPLIREKIHEVVLKVIGNTTELSMSKIVNRSRYLGVANNVAFLGWMEWDQIIQELRNTDLVVIPSIYEPFGCTVVEGMAMGLPVLGSRTGGIKENIVDGETGVLFEVGNSKDLAEKAIWLLKEDGLRKKIGIKAAEYAKRAFHPDVVAAQHLRLYQSICSSMN